MCDTLTEKASDNRLIMEGHASAWHHQEEAAHSGFLAQLLTRCTRALGYATTVPVTLQHKCCASDKNRHDDRTLRCVLRCVSHYSQGKRGKQLPLNGIYELCVFMVGVPNAICLEISPRTKLLSEDSIKSSFISCRLDNATYVDRMTNLRTVEEPGAGNVAQQH